MRGKQIRGLIAAVILMITAGVLAATEYIKYRDLVVPETAVAPSEVMHAADKSFVRVKGRPDYVAATSGLLGGESGAVINLEGEPRLLIYLPKNNPLARAIHDDDFEAVNREREFIGQVQVGEENEIPTLVMQSLLKDLSLQEKSIRVLDIQVSPTESSNESFGRAIFGSCCFLVLGLIAVLVLVGLLRGGKNKNSDTMPPVEPGN